MFLRASLLLLFLIGCNVSYAGLFDDDKAREEISDLRNQVAEMEARIVKMEEILKSQALVELYTQAETLNNELGKLRGQIEVLNNNNESLKKRQKDFYLDLDNRLRQIENPNAPANPESSDSSVSSAISSAEYSESELAIKSTPKSLSSLTTPSSSAADDDDDLEPPPPGSEQSSAYETAYSLFKNGDYSGAISQFENFLESYPESRLAPGAAYWIGNAHYALRDFQRAIDAQENLISQYPDSDKIPDALLNIASSQQEIIGKSAARATLEELIAKYPFSAAAEKAKRRLTNLK